MTPTPAALERARRRPLGRLVGRAAAQVAEALATPLVPADYLDLIDPLRAGADLRGRIVESGPRPRTPSTLVIRPGRGWPGHVPGQYIRIGVDVDGVRNWRAYSLTSPPAPRAGRLHHHHGQGDPRRRGQQPPGPRGAAPGTLIMLDQATGDFVLPDARPGQGPLPHRRQRHHPGHGHAAQPPRRARRRRRCVHSRPHRGRRHLRRRAAARSPQPAGSACSSSTPTRDGVLDLADLDDARARTGASARPGPAAPPACSTPPRRTGRAPASPTACTPSASAPPSSRPARAARVTFAAPAPSVEADGATPILDAGEEAGVLMPSGCRMGICFGCVVPLREGAVRDLRNGDVTVAEPGRRVPSRPACRPPPAPATSTSRSQHDRHRET